MSECFDFYIEQAKQCDEQCGWLAGIQEKALADFLHFDFPTRRNEDWKYTSLDDFFKHRFQARTSSINETLKNNCYGSAGNEIAFINGKSVSSSDWQKKLPSGVLIMPLQQALQEHKELVKMHLGSVLEHTNGFQALNTAMMQSGVFIYLPKDACIAQPILLAHTQNDENVAAHYRHLIVAEQGSSANITEDYFGDGDNSYFTNTVTEISLAASAQITHYKIQRESAKAYHIGHVAVNQSAGSKYNSHSLSFGGCLVRSDITVDFNESEASCLLNGLYVPGEEQHVDHHTIINHAVANCVSKQNYKGILMGKSRAVFNGRVVVAQDAQKSKADQSNKNLLLSEKSEIDTKPQLEIYADDVMCTHGATVGQLDDDALFYLASRGIGREEASRILVEAFAADNLNLMEDDVVRNLGAKLLTTALEDANG